MRGRPPDSFHCRTSGASSKLGGELSNARGAFDAVAHANGSAQPRASSKPRKPATPARNASGSFSSTRMNWSNIEYCRPLNTGSLRPPGVSQRNTPGRGIGPPPQWALIPMKRASIPASRSRSASGQGTPLTSCWSAVRGRTPSRSRSVASGTSNSGSNPLPISGVTPKGRAQTSSLPAAWCFRKRATPPSSASSSQSSTGHVTSQVHFGADSSGQSSVASNRSSAWWMNSTWSRPTIGWPWV